MIIDDYTVQYAGYRKASPQPILDSISDTYKEAMARTSIFMLGQPREEWHVDVVPNRRWEQIELERTTNGRYQLPILPDIINMLIVHRRHYLHLHHSHEDMVEFVANSRDGVRRKHTVLSFRRYLSRHFREYLTQEEIEDIVNQNKIVYGNAQLSIAKTPNEIDKVYSLSATFYSCMQKKAFLEKHPEWKPEFLPAFIYGAGDLAVAYVTDNHNQLLARAVINETTKKVGRVFGDIRLFHSLLGWNNNSNGYRYDSFKGNKLLRIDYAGKVIAPYIDGNNMYLAMDHNKGGLVITGGKHETYDYVANTQDGYAYPSLQSIYGTSK